MESNKVTQLTARRSYINTKLKKQNQTTSILGIEIVDHKNYKIYTPEIIKKYKDSFKNILKILNDEDKARLIVYNQVLQWYENKENINISMEKIYIKTKLGSITSGGCGIGASFFAGLIANGIFSYIDSYMKKLEPLFISIYALLILFFGIKIISKEDNHVEMYNVFLEVLDTLENDKNDK